MEDGNSNDTGEAEKPRGPRITQKTLDGLAAALDGMTPRQKGAEKAAQALEWIYKWGWSTSSVIAQLAGTGKNSALGARLVKNGWAKRQPIRIVSSYKVTPTDILTITPEGVAELTALQDELPRSRNGAVGKRIIKKDVIHDLLVQTLTLQYMDRTLDAIPGPFRERHGVVRGFATAHQISDDIRQRKIPDAIWFMENGKRLAIELELSPKFGRELDVFISRHCEMQKKNAKGRVDGLLTFFSSPYSAERYTDAMKAGVEVKYWLWNPDDLRWYTPLVNPTFKIPETFAFHAQLVRDQFA